METIKKLYVVRGSGFGVVVSLPETDEEKSAGYGSVSFDTQVWGQAPTWDDIIAALYWGDENIGEPLERAAMDAHRARTAPWRVGTHTGMSGRVDYLVRVRDEAAEKYGTAGKITVSLHISCAGKLNRGVRTMSLADWYVLLKTVPSLSWPEIEKGYKNCPPRELPPVEDVQWHAPGAEPWDGGKTASDEEPVQEKGEGKDYTLEEIRERVRENYAAMMAQQEGGAEENSSADEAPDPPEKYEILREPQYAHPDTGNRPGTYRIRALRDIPRWGIKAGDLGGFVGGEFTLSHSGDAWIADSAVASADSRVYGNAILAEHAQVDGGSHIFEGARIRDESHVFSESKVHGRTTLNDRALVCHSDIAGKISLSEHARVERLYLLARGEIKLDGHSSLRGDREGTI